MRGDRGADAAGLVRPVGCGAGRLLCDGLAGFADHDLHAVVLARVAGRVLEAPLVHDAGRGGDVLVDVLASLGCGDLAPHVARVGRIRGVVAALHLDGVGTGGGIVGFPAELAGIPVVELAVQRVADDAGLRADYGEVGCVVPAVDPLVLVDDLVAAIIERAVHQMVRQIRRIIRHRLHVSGSLRFGGLDGVLLATLIRRDLAGRVGCVLVIGQLVGTGELDVVHEIADVVAGQGLNIFEAFEALEHEYRVLLSFGHLVIAFVRLPLAAMVSGIGVGYLCGDGRGLPAHLVAMAVRGDAGHLHRRRVGRVGAHEDLHLVGMGGLAAGVLQPDLVQHAAVAGGHVLVDAGVVLLGDDLRIRVLGVAVLLQFDP